MLKTLNIYLKYIEYVIVVCSLLLFVFRGFVVGFLFVFVVVVVVVVVVLFIGVIFRWVFCLFLWVFCFVCVRVFAV